MDLTCLLLFPLLAGVGTLVLRNRKLGEWLNLVACFGYSAMAALTWIRVLRHGTATAWSGFLRADALSALILGLTAFVALVCSVYAIGFFHRDLRDHRIQEKQVWRYYVLTPLLLCAMTLALLADNLGVMWVALESTTLASVLLVTLYNQKTSFEAGWKYIIIGSVGISLALFGTVITYSSAVGVLGEHASHGMNWSVLVEIADKLDPAAMRLAFILVLLGYGTKAGLAPMHTWKPDAYSEAPVPSAAMLGAGFINCAIYAILRFDTLAEKCLGHAFPSRLLIGFGLFSILLAAPFVLVQRNFRRLLAYSSIDHAGIMVAAIGFGGKLGLLGAVFHMVFHAVTKPLMFFSMGDIQQHFGSPYFRKVRGVVHTLPWTGTLALLATFAITGLPPFSLFQSEWLVLSGAFAANQTWGAVLFLLGVITIFAGFLGHMAALNLGAPLDNASSDVKCPWTMGAMLAVALVVVLLGVALPDPLYQLVQRSVQVIGGAP